MDVYEIDIFNWILNNHQKAKHIMAFSNSFDISYKKFQTITNFQMPTDFLMNYNNAMYAEELKETFMKYYKCGIENVVLTCGGTESNYLIFQSFLKKGDEVLVEQPGYSPLWITPKMLGMHIRFFKRSYEQYFSLNESLFEKLLTKKTKLVVLTNLHNPSGTYAKNEELRKLAEIASDNGVYLLIDEIFLDGCFHENETAFRLPNVIVTSSVTKIYGLGGLRSGWIIGPKEITMKCRKLKYHTNSMISEATVLMILHGLTKGKKILQERFLNMAKTNLAIVDKWIKENNHLVDYVKPAGGIICFPKYKTSISSTELCQKLLDKYKVLIIPGQLFNYEGHFRLSYNLDEDLLIEGLDALTQGLEEFL